jgi:ribulose-5-phosphate 4-epimerase/fuculose-1-phosphate aldolase
MTSQSESVRIDPAEDILRRDLAACYRLVAHFGWDDLVKVDHKGNVLNSTDWAVNQAGFVINSAIHQVLRSSEALTFPRRVEAIELAQHSRPE